VQEASADVRESQMHFIPNADSPTCPIKKTPSRPQDNNIKLHPLPQLEGHSSLRHAAIFFSSQFIGRAGRSGQKAGMAGHPQIEADQPSSKDTGGFK